MCGGDVAFMIDGNDVTLVWSMMHLRIIHYSPGIRLELGGVVRAVLDWCTILKNHGHDVVLATFDSPDIPADWNGAADKPTVVMLPPAYRPNGFVPKECVRQFEELLTPGSVLHMHCPWTASNMQMARAARKRGVPYVVSIHGMLDDWAMAQRTLKKRLFLAAGGRRYLQRAAHIHYSAAAERDQAMKWISRAKPVVLPLMMDLGPFEKLPGPEAARVRFKINPDVPLMLFLSRIHPKKGLHVLMDALALQTGAAKESQLIIAGTSAPADKEYDTQLRQQIERLGLRDRVYFAGMVTGTDKISLYQAADMFVLPTFQENVGLVLLEAMAAGTPVLTTRGTDIWQEIQQAGGTISDNTPAALCESLKVLLADRAALKQSGERARQWVLEQFNEDKLTAEYEAMYSQVIEGA
jgi:glycosyltransferase involved in cell wall biosynthesis